MATRENICHNCKSNENKKTILDSEHKKDSSNSNNSVADLKDFDLMNNKNPRKLKRRQLDKFKFQSAGGLEFKKSVYDAIKKD